MEGEKLPEIMITIIMTISSLFSLLNGDWSVLRQVMDSFFLTNHSFANVIITTFQLIIPSIQFFSIQFLSIQFLATQLVQGTLLLHPSIPQ